MHLRIPLLLFVLSCCRLWRVSHNLLACYPERKRTVPQTPPPSPDSLTPALPSPLTPLPKRWAPGQARLSRVTRGAPGTPPARTPHTHRHGGISLPGVPPRGSGAVSRSAVLHVLGPGPPRAASPVESRRDGGGDRESGRPGEALTPQPPHADYGSHFVRGIKVGTGRAHIVTSHSPRGPQRA